ncbi:MAG TPA: NAD-glutamate dehydrogenase [Alphaproteobacteria bacterium]|nr:NAD-glutamate dehydrogenase [Alphaproteobacteria bacterium]
MPNRAEDQKNDLISRLVKRVGDRMQPDRAAEIELFVRQLYANVPPGDLLRNSVEDLYGISMGLWNFSQQRNVGNAKIRVFNPTPAEHGWRSTHSVVEIANDDMPFLVDSVTAELNRQDLTVHLVIHPVMKLRRDSAGKRMQLLAQGAETAEADKPPVLAESLMHIQINEQSAPERLAEIESGLARVLADVRVAVQDWRAMHEKLAEVLREIEADPPPLPREEVEETKEFLHWISDDHFTFLGYREYDFTGEGDGATLQIRAGSGLGVLRDDAYSVFDGLRNFDKLPPEVRQFVLEPRLLLITKSNRRATVHRAVHMDTIGIKRFDAQGRVIGERLLVGLLTSVAYSRSPRQIPLLRRKVQNILARAGFPPSSHDGKALTHILETYPRDELLQIGEQDLYDIGLGILHLQERQQIALFVRRDPFERFVSCLLYVPRERFNTALRLRFQKILERAYDGKVTAYTTYMTDEVLGRLHVVVATKPGAIPAVPTAEVEARLIEAGRSWSDDLQDALISGLGEERGIEQFRRYANAFPLAYRERFAAGLAVYDITRIEEALERERMAINLYRPIEASGEEVRLKIYNAQGQVALSDILPMLEHMGLRVISEIPFEVQPIGGGTIWVHDFAMRSADGGEIQVGRVREKFEEALSRIWLGEMEDDGFNRLILRASLGWRRIVVLRACCKFLRQTGIAFSQSYMEETLANNPKIARALIELFRTRFSPELQDRSTRERGIIVEIEHALDAVANLDEDRILRRFLNLILSTLRTNFYQNAANGISKPYLSLKFDSRELDELPLPRPWVEIFVYSPRVEAVHLRGGKVARGGIRWSDRREDFRTEVLGLMKAQMVKNAVIVPVGSKGGFVVKRPPAQGGREALNAEVIECYRIMMRGLLDLADNLVAGAVVPPTGVIRHDEDDPYLVVAADKGTATFSDIANAVSADYGFWLGDAFASGGSAGYDHKKMGITARGAWECVKRHFRELGVDIQTTDFTTVGVGDMSGDVFGNGMLLSEHTRLVAAFNHLHIFIDPDPDPQKSLAERRRLFELPRSSWSDYDPAMISKGGGVYDRKAKTIRLSPEMKALFGMTHESATPAELIRTILKLPVDLLWLGGIGTYAKATSETNLDVGDRANDALRVNGSEVRAKVVGEGANLGFTQRGRIEYVLNGGRINTDAVDNSAGVDTSDHEVNIKILLNGLIAEGDLTLKQRDQLLAGMTEEVGALVLRDNYLQSLALSLAEAKAPERLDGDARFMRALERSGKLNRAIEFLPSEEALAERAQAHAGLTRPEEAVLLAYSKITLYDELLASSLPDDPALQDDVRAYFPAVLGRRFPEAIQRHRLRREIAATLVVNELVNRMGATFMAEMRERTGAAAEDVARGYLAARAAFALPRLWQDIEALDNKVPAKLQYRMLLETLQLVERACHWFLKNRPLPLDTDATVAEFEPALRALKTKLDQVLADDDRAEILRRAGELVAGGVPEPLAHEVAGLDFIAPGLDIVRIAGQAGLPAQRVARTFFALGNRFAFDWLRDTAEQLDPDSHWDKLAVAAILDDLQSQQCELAARVLKEANGADAEPEILIEDWIKARAAPVERADTLISELRQSGAPDLAMLAVANRQLRTLVMM